MRGNLFDRETKIFTTRGWVKALKVMHKPETFKIVSYNIKTGERTVLSPSERTIVIDRFKGKMVHIYNLYNTDQMVTPHHSVVTVSHRGIVRTQIAERVLWNNETVIPYFPKNGRIVNTVVRNSKSIKEIEEVDYEGYVWGVKTKNAVIVKREGKTAISGGM